MVSSSVVVGDFVGMLNPPAFDVVVNAHSASFVCSYVAYLHKYSVLD